MTAPSGDAARSEDWDRHWSAYADSNSLNPAQAYRRALIFAGLDLPGASGPIRVLEIGSGHGELSHEIVRRHAAVELVGIDLSRRGVEVAAERVPSARFFQQDLMRPMALPPQMAHWATHAVCSEVLEHVQDPVSALRNVRDCLGVGCRLVITVPSGPMSAFDRHIGHLRHFTTASLAGSLQAAGFEVVDLQGAGFPFFNLYRLAVIARGQALIADAEAMGDGRAPPFAARLLARAFSELFKLNSPRTARGWQLVAIASPGGAT